ncbi:MAG: hypothetical protein WCK64_00190 [Synechococcaceae cyanobacterium ELA445]|jgi:hypothetical protein
MADPITSSTQPQERQEGGFRGNRGAVNRGEGSRGNGERGGGERGGGPREAGGFRIRLSDNELRAAQVVQEAFQLRSTVAALGLSIRTVAQLLEEGKLDELVARHRAQGPAAGGADAGRERRTPRPERGGEGRGAGRGGAPVGRANPFARPSRPAPIPSTTSETSAEEPSAAELEPLEADTTADLLNADPVSADFPAAEGAATAETAATVEEPGAGEG